MKKSICFLVMGFCVLGFCAAQEQENTWRGTVRFDPADIFINMHNALPGMSVTWTPFISPNLGIPAELDVHVGWGVLPGVQVSFLSGAEFFPLRPAGRDKTGLLLNAKIGLSLFFHEGVSPAFVTKAGAGYQFITERGFVFTPAVGAVYNGRSGFGLNVKLAFGFAYR